MSKVPKKPSHPQLPKGPDPSAHMSKAMRSIAMKLLKNGCTWGHFHWYGMAPEREGHSFDDSVYVALCTRCKRTITMLYDGRHAPVVDPTVVRELINKRCTKE